MSARFFWNSKRHKPARAAVAPPDQTPIAFHRRLPGYEPTPLVSVPELARVLGVGDVLLKVESSRFGLPAFKILGASWAVYRALEARLGRILGPWRTLEELAQNLAPIRPITLAAATDGNHGRAVARMAALLQFQSRIYVPAGTAQARIDAIASEGAQVEVINGTYDQAVERSARDAGERCLVISDTSWPGYEDVPRSVIDGYSTIMSEIDDELARRDEPGPEFIAVQFGVGALAAAVVKHYRAHRAAVQPGILSVEPLSAACMLASMEAGEIVLVPGPHVSIMAGLNCGRPSIVAWPIVSTGIDGFIAVNDERAREAMRALARVGIVAGETGAAGLAGLLELLTGPENEERRAELHIDTATRVLVFVTEGATNPASYADILSLSPTESSESPGRAHGTLMMD
ncbi:MAG: diaminopropionate ammonia-lyase [Chthoniobacterales bacterium]|nr:diaminopropionate ammonia-lyase [Chthoniobacterales bacterium]